LIEIFFYIFSTSCDHTGHENVNIRAAFIHIFGDLIQSIGVLFASLLIRWTGFELADPLCTFIFSMIVVCTSIPVAKDIFMALMEGIFIFQSCASFIENEKL
jgi:Co/Zn/Cd efflux system component